MFEEEVVDSNVEPLLDIDDEKGEWFCCDWIGDIGVVVNVDFRVESGNWKLDEVNARIMIVLIMFLSIRIILIPFAVELRNEKPNNVKLFQIQMLLVNYKSCKMR